jgi:HEAT repeat protein
VAPAPAPTTPEERIRLIAKDLKDPTPEKRIKALALLAASGAEAKIASVEMIEAMHIGPQEVRDAASEAFEKVDLKVHRHVFTIIRGTSKYDALSHLSEMGEGAKAAIPLLHYWIAHPGEFSVPGSEGASPFDRPNLGTGKRYVLDVIFKIDRTDAKLREAVLTAISRSIGDTEREHLLDRQWAIMRLRSLKVKNEDKVKAFMAALDDKHLTGEVIDALGNIGRDAAPALPILKKLKLSADDTIRSKAIAAIQRIEE